MIETIQFKNSHSADACRISANMSADARSRCPASRFRHGTVMPRSARISALRRDIDEVYIGDYDGKTVSEAVA